MHTKKVLHSKTNTLHYNAGFIITTLQTCNKAVQLKPLLSSKDKYTEKRDIFACFVTVEQWFILVLNIINTCTRV